MRAIAEHWKFRLYWFTLVTFCLGLLLAMIGLAGSQPGIVLAFFVLLVCGVGATIDRLWGPQRWVQREGPIETSPRTWLRRELGVSVTAPEAQRMALALETLGDPLEIISGCAWMKWLANEHEKRSTLSHYIVMVSGARPPFGKPKKTQTTAHSVSRAQRYLGMPEASPRDLAEEFLQRGPRLALGSPEPAEHERAEREATDICLEYQSLMGWR